MKNIIFIFTVFFTISFVSCSDSDSEDVNVFSEGYLEVNIEGDFYRKDFKLTNLDEASTGSISYDNDNNINIILKINDLNDRISLTIDDVKGVGVFEIKGYTSTSISYYDGEIENIYHTNYNSGSGISIGKIVVSKLDIENKIIEGTFEGRLIEGKGLRDTLLISEGKFSGTYIKIGL
ncbi:hypothetical protein H3Z83_11095 [Tenacibaculum sp. S7007]|uniref:Uncharacterized protein n=1 Tax=Tenacibaculum pelagium TaxID=2759527 RepID=A0A839ASG7_9FLAO|nr:hypothetical protein [Tenacibaculum pelagium]MBA6157064.1 hypothetical protein [Tenacibaculum pelagium]